MLKRLIFAILIVLNCMTIFYLSSQNAETSSETSSGIVEKVVDIITSINKDITRDSIRDQVTFFVRKTAHFSIYSLLGIWLMNEANTFDISIKRKIFICLIFGALYAFSDEFHQSMISGRSREFRDICIDTCGVIFGGTIVLIFGRIINSTKKKRKEKI